MCRVNILQTVKYYEPSKGGMESVVKDIVTSVSDAQPHVKFTVYSNSHIRILKKQIIEIDRLTSIKERTPILFKSQPLNLGYPTLRELILDHDIVHHHYPFPNMELALMRNISLLKKKRLIITWHANIKSSRWSWIAKFYDPIIKKLLDIAEYVVVTSPQLLENSDILQGYKDKVKVIPLSFDPSVVVSQKPKKYPSGRRFRLLFVGRLREYKGIKHLIEAIKDLDVELTIVGDGENRHSLLKQVDILNIGDRVKFRSNLSNDELATCYSKCDVFVLPSINEAEAFGVVQLEAMSNGLPVINTNLKSGVPYVSLAGVTGETVAPNNTEELKQAIKKILDSPQLFEIFSKNALERVNSFSREKLAQSYSKIYSI